MSSGFRFKERKESLLAPPKTLVNAHSSGGSAGTALTNIANQDKDILSAALTAASAGVIAVGVPSSNTGYPTMPTDRIDWKTSLSVSIKSSVTETDKVSAVVAYQLF